MKLYFNPAVSVSAFILHGKDEVLLIRRAKDPGKGLLATVGGFVDMGESAEEALRREIREEIRLEVTEVDFLASHPNTYHFAGIAYPVLDLFFTCRTAGLESAAANDEVTALVSRKIVDVSPDEMAFGSMQEALLILLSKFTD